MNLKYLFNRTKNILINPDTEFKNIRTEQSSFKDQLNNIVIPYSIIIAISDIVGNIIFNRNTVGIGTDIIQIIVRSVFAFILFYFASYISVIVLDKLFHNYSKSTTNTETSKVIINSLIAYYITTALGCLIPAFSLFFSLLGLYSIVILWYGIKELIKINKDKLVGIYILSVLILFTIFFILRFIIGSIIVLISTI